MEELHAKMAEYMACGCRLGWLIDPAARATHVYAEGAPIALVPFEEPLSGGELMPGLAVVMATLA
jgi:Uma2 family endonuclease